LLQLLIGHLSTAIAGVFLDLYNLMKLGIGCWVAPYPVGCSDEGSMVHCERGENADAWIWLFAGVMVNCVLIFVMVCMITMYIQVRHQIRKMQRRYSIVRTQNETNANSAKLKLTLQQASLYIFSFLLTYLFTAIMRKTENNRRHKSFFVLSFLSQIFYPLQ